MSWRSSSRSHDLITSPGNSAIKRIRSLRSRKGREEASTFFVEGIRIVAEAIELGAQIDTLVIAPDMLTSPFAHEIAERALNGGVDVLYVSSRVFESLSEREGPQGIGAVVRSRLVDLESLDPASGLCCVVLEAVADPGNLGSILRTCDAVGAAGVILVGASTDPFDPAVVRASMGAMFSQPVARTSLPELAGWKSRHGVLLVGTSDAAEVDYRDAEYGNRSAIFMGSERQGLSEEAKQLCDELVRIPMTGRSDSLNLSVATGVVLYELFDRRHPLSPGERRAVESDGESG